jgi:hypothetical protein
MALGSVFLRRFGLPAAAKTTPRLRALSALRVPVPPAPPFTSPRCVRGVATLSAGDALARLAADHPHQEVLRYEHKNVKWTLKHVNYYADALACGMVDAGLQPGDKVLSWLPLHFAEQVRGGSHGRSAVWSAVFWQARALAPCQLLLR